MTDMWKALEPAIFYELVLYAVSMAADHLIPGLDVSWQTFLSGVLALPILIRMHPRCESCRERPALASTAARCLILAGALAAGAALSVSSAWLMRFLGIAERFSNAAQEAYFASAWPGLILGPGLLAPLAEELVYRKLVYERMRKMLGLWPAALLSASLFALTHGNMIQILYAFPMGLLFQFAYVKAKRWFAHPLLVPVLMHAGANGISILLQGRI